MKSMKKTMKMMLALSMFALMGSIPFMAAQAGKGVKCNDQKQVCRDRSGLSVEQTRQRYGDQAAQRLQRHLSKGGGKQGGGKQGGGKQGGGKQGGGKQGGGKQKESGNVFSPLGGVRCVRSERVCYHYNQPSYQFTQQYFGPSAASRLNR